MTPTLTWLAGCVCFLSGTPAAAAPDSYLTTITSAANGAAASSKTEPYVPREGDLVCYNDHNATWKFLYRIFGSDLPDHAGLVVRLPNDGAAVLESGPDDGSTVGPYVFLMDALPRFNQFQMMFHGQIYIRRLRCPLTPEQSDQLTDWAMAQCGKHYPTCRLLLQGTPFRCRCGMRETLFARTDPNRKRFLCCELAICGLTRVGVFNPQVIKANRVYPRDILYDDHFDISESHLPAGIWTAHPPAEPVAPIQAEIPEEAKRGRQSCVLMPPGKAPQAPMVPNTVATSDRVARPERSAAE
jgi:hypothetical protein